MKISQINNQLEIKNNGIGQLIFGVVLFTSGLALAIFLLINSSSGNGNQTPAWVALIGLGVSALGVALAFFAKNRYITIEKGGQTTVTDKRLIGNKTRQQSIPTANIKAIRLSTYMDQSGTTNGNRTNTRRSVLSLLLNNNDLVEIANSSGNSGFSFNGMNISSLITKAPLSNEAGQIATFLGVPLDADDTSTISGAIKSIKDAFGQSSQPEQITKFNSNGQQTDEHTNTTPQQPPTSQNPNFPPR